jgi:hypothetical protein
LLFVSTFRFLAFSYKSQLKNKNKQGLSFASLSIEVVDFLMHYFDIRCFLFSSKGAQQILEIIYFSLCAGISHLPGMGWKVAECPV